MKDNVYEGIASKSILKVVSSKMLSPTLAQVTFNVFSATDKQSIRAAVATHLKNLAKAVDGTMRVYDDKGTTCARVIVESSAKRMSLRDAEGMTVVSANVMRDSMDNIWSVEGKGDSATIVQQGTEDLESILRQRQRTTAAVIEPTPAIGDFAKVFDIESRCLRYGFLTSDGVLDIKTHKEVACTADQVIAYQTDIAKLPVSSKERLKEYIGVLCCTPC